MSPLQILAKCPLAKCPLAKSPGFLNNRLADRQPTQTITFLVIHKKLYPSLICFPLPTNIQPGTLSGQLPIPPDVLKKTIKSSPPYKDFQH